MSDFFFFFLMKEVTRNARDFVFWDRSKCVGNKFVEGGGWGIIEKG